MNTRTTSKSALFLMELILAIFFFSLASAVCIQLFAKAHLLGEDTTNKNHGIMWAQNIAEAYLGNDGDMNATVDTLQGIANGPDSFSLYFDQTWHSCTADQSAYTASVQVTETNLMHAAHIVIASVSTDSDGHNTSGLSDSTGDVASKNIIYELTVSKHLPLTAE